MKNKFEAIKYLVTSMLAAAFCELVVIAGFLWLITEGQIILAIIEAIVSGGLLIKMVIEMDDYWRTNYYNK